MRSPLPLLLAASFTALPAAAGERAAIVLHDGQTIEGEADVFDGGDVEILVDLGGSKQRLRLAASAIARIEPLSSRSEETVPEAVVRLVDGRELRGEARVRSSEVVVKGPYGQVVVSRDDVRSIAPVLPELPRTVADADTGLVLPLPTGWFADEPGGVAERLRLVKDDGAASISVVLRRLGSGADDAARVRQALRHDLTRGATLEPLEGRRWRVRDAATDHAVPGTWPLHLVGVAQVADDHVVFFKLLADGSTPLDAALPQVLDAVVAGQATLEGGASRDGGFFRDPKLGLFLEAPAGFRVRESKEPGERVRVVSPSDATSRLVVHVVDGPSPKDALLDLLEAPPETTEEVPLPEGAPAFRARSARERGVALRTGAGTVAVVAQAARAEPLAQLTLGVVLIQPAALDEALAEGERLLPLLDRAREALDHDDAAAALAALDPVLAEHPDDPVARGLRVAALRARKEPDDVLIEELDAAWVAAGSPWIAQELARALVARSSELTKADEHERALEAIERAAEAWGDDAVVGAAVDLFVRAARRAFQAGEPLVTWSKLGRLRELVGPRPEVDAAEAELRLESAKRALRAKDAAGARRDARRAWAVGADGAAVEAIYAEADKVDLEVEADKAKERADRQRRRGGGGGFEFGIPPTQNPNTTRRIKPTAFERPANTTSRFVRPIKRERGSRVRPRNDPPTTSRYRSQPTRKGRRVRSNGRFVFE